MYLLSIGIDHHTAPVEVREKLAFGKVGLAVIAGELQLLPVLSGFVILSTCNRTEIYATSAQMQAGLAAIRSYLKQKSGLDDKEAKRYFQTWTGDQVITHIFRVASGLESMVLGETEILGQVRTAYETACSLKTGNSVLHSLFREAIRVGKDVRTRTGIDQHPASVSYAAVELVRQTFGSLDGCTVLIVGAGEMGELTLKHLVSQGVSTVLVSNRSFERAEGLAAQYGGEAIRYDHLNSELGRADIVVSCTAATHFVITADKIRQAFEKRDGRPLFFIDIAVPRDIEPGVRRLPGVILYDIDDLQQVVIDFMEERHKAAVVAKGILDQAVGDFLQWLSTLTVLPAIKALQQRGQRVKEIELTKYLNRLGTLDPRTEKLVRAMANSLVNQILCKPVASLKKHAGGPDAALYCEVLGELFDLQEEMAGDGSEVYESEPNLQEQKLAGQRGGIS